MFSFTKERNKIKFEFEKFTGVIYVVSPAIINVFVPTYREEKLSRAIEATKMEPCKFDVIEEENRIVITTSLLTTYVYDEFKIDFYDKDGKLICEDYRGKREGFQRDGSFKMPEEIGNKVHDVEMGQKVQVLKKMQGDEYFYGLGDKTGHLNKRGYFYKMWNSDVTAHHVESFEELYKSIPFFITLRKKISYGIFFDNTFKSYFDMGKENTDYFYFGAKDGNIDYYFIYGPTVKNVLSGYTYLTGTNPLPQFWTLGYQQCRFSYTPEQKVWEIADNFRKRDIPCDAIYLDIDYMDGYRVFTWDKDKFKDFRGMNEKLKAKGFKVITIIDPGVKKDKHYKIYQEGLKNEYFATDKDDLPYVNEVWPGDVMFPDFSDKKTRAWWSENQKILLDEGVSGIWNDMNEPASFNGPLPEEVEFKNDGNPTNHSEIHNVYGHLMCKATYEGIKKYTEKRPFIVTRACYAGTQKYSTVWTGDNQSTWEHLRMAVPMLLNLGLSGIGISGTDVGGFGADCTSELLSRWVQLGAFSSLFRNHTACYSRNQEPWAFDKETEDINRKYIKLRYKLLPYLYDLMWQVENIGVAPMRPLFLHYQDDKKTYEINDEFMFGENIIVAPVVSQGTRERIVYLPEGDWTDYWSHEIIQGGKSIIKDAPLDTCPIYIKSGSIIPNYPEQNYVGEKVIKDLILDIYPGDGDYISYQDDGESFNYQQGVYNLYEIKMVKSQKLYLDFDILHQGYEKTYDNFILKFNNIKPKSIIVDGESYDFAGEREIKISTRSKHVEIE